MAQDAGFLDGGDKPLNIAAQDAEDLQVLSSLVQDAIFPVTEMMWDAKARRFGILVNRFRWELPQTAASRPERVQSVLAFENVEAVSSQGVDRNDVDTVMSILSVEFEDIDTPSGAITLVLAGDGAIRLKVEALEARLRDVTRPYSAPSGKSPKHD